MSDLIIKKKLRNIAEDINGERPSNRSLEGILEAIEKGAGITYDPFPKTLKGRLRELGLQLNGVRPTQKSLRNIVNNIVENYEGGGGGGSAKIYGVSGLYDENTTLTRTDDAVDMNYMINLDGTVTSDFDNVFPYNEMVRETINNNVFVKVPSMWFRVGTDDDNNITDIAVSKEKGKKGNWYQTKEFYYGAYCGYVNNNESNKKVYSISGVTPSSNLGRTFITYAENNGSDYMELDLYHFTIINFLFLIEFANKNALSIFPMTLNSVQNTGGTDIIQASSGVLDNGRMKWRNIEDLFGNMAFVLAGVLTYSGVTYATSDSSKYKYNNTYYYNELSYKTVSNYGATTCSFGWDENNPFLCMPKETISNLQYDNYFCSRSNVASGTDYHYWVGRNFEHTEIGFQLYNFGVAKASFSTIGARLLYCPNGV